MRDPFKAKGVPRDPLENITPGLISVQRALLASVIEGYKLEPMQYDALRGIFLFLAEIEAYKQ